MFHVGDMGQLFYFTAFNMIINVTKKTVFIAEMVS